MKSLKTSIGLGTLLISLQCVTVSSAQGLPTAKPNEVDMSAKKLAAVDNVINSFLTKRELAGVVTIVARRGKVVQFKAYGMQDIAAKKPMKKDTIFRIYSMTKAVVSVAAMILVEKKKLELDVPASRYIPALGRMKYRGKLPKREMTLRDLLRHTAGFPNNVSTGRALERADFPPLHKSTLEEMMNRLEVVPLRYEPGRGWYYSFAADVVARLVEIGSGKRVDRALKELIFDPLGMKDTDFYVPKSKRHRFAVAYGNGLRPIQAPHPGTTGPFDFAKRPKFQSGGGGLVSTASDYMRFCLMLSGKGKFAGKRLLTGKTVELMTGNQLPKELGEITRRPAGRGFGLGFAVRTRKIDSAAIGEYEWLGGLGTEFFISPKYELVVITLSNQGPMRQIKRVVRPVVYAALKQKKSAATKKRDKFLVLDSRIIESTRNAKLTPGTVTKHKNNPLFGEDKSWEPRFDNMYPNVIYDDQEKLYKCWYSPFIKDERTTATPKSQRNPRSKNYMKARPAGREEALLYATSKDGIRWTKPSLGIVKFQGSKANNIVRRGLGGSGVIKDNRDPNPQRRYKAFYCTNAGYKMRYSSDGLRWGAEVSLRGVGQSDTHANLIWSPELGKYIGILRHYDPLPITGHRKIARTESYDAVHWTKSKTILTGTPLKQLHDMVIFRDGGVFLGLVGCMHYPSKQSRHGVRQHIELAWSPDSYKWYRISPGTPFIAGTPSNRRVYGKMPHDWGVMFPSAPVFRKDEVRIYYGASDWYFFDWRKGCLALATIGRDRWAGYQPIDARESAVVVTKPFAGPMNRLRVTADVGPGGFVRVSLGNAIGRVISRSVTNTQVQWLDSVKSKGKLRFELKNAKLYSFGFER